MKGNLSLHSFSEAAMSFLYGLLISLSLLFRLDGTYHLRQPMR